MTYTLIDQKLENISDFKGTSADYVRCFVDSARTDLATFLCEKNFAFADRTMKAIIPLKSSADFQKFCRLKIELSEPNERIHEIAKKSFTQDVRFWTEFPPTMNVEVFENFFAAMKVCYICCVKNEIAGFIEIAERDSEAVIRLAAVDEKFRLSGAALSLYAGASDLFRQKGHRKLVGRISTRNMPVVNLYSTLGAIFSEPQDVYIRK